jgi:hypothetical protein
LEAFVVVEAIEESLQLLERRVGSEILQDRTEIIVDGVRRRLGVAGFDRVLDLDLGVDLTGLDDDEADFLRVHIDHGVLLGCGLTLS